MDKDSSNFNADGAGRAGRFFVGGARQSDDSKPIHSRFSPSSILMITILGITLAEIFAMVVIYYFRGIPYYQQVFIDASIMVVIIFPILYFLSFRPILQQIQHRYEAEKDSREREQKEHSLRQTIHNMQLDIARDLHDTIGQNIGFLRMKLDYLVDSNPPPTEGMMQAELIQMSRVATESYDLVRGTLAVLQSREPGDLLHLFKRFADQVVERSGLEVDFADQGEPVLVSSRQMRQLFYIFREALSNIEKHSGASRAIVNLCWEPEMVTLSISDNGRGFDAAMPPAMDSRYGLRFMRERAEMMNGLFQLKSTREAGTSISIRVPLEATHA